MDCCGCLSTDECPPGYRLLQPEDLAVGKDGKSGARMSRVFVTVKAAGGSEAAVCTEATGPAAIGAEVSSPHKAAGGAEAAVGTEAMSLLPRFLAAR